MATRLDSYSSGAFGASQTIPLMGNAGTALLLTPQKGTGAETKTHTTTLVAEYVPHALILRRVQYNISTAQTGAGNNLAIDIYNGTTSVGAIAVTTQTSYVASSELNSTVAAGGYVRIIAKSTTTASDANAAVGRLLATYQEVFS